MNLFAFSGLATGLTSLALGIFVLFMRPQCALNRVWFYFTGSVALWGFGSLWIALAQDHDSALWAWRLAFAFAVVWIPILFYHFVTLFCGLPGRGVLKANYVIGLVFAACLSTSWFFSDVRYVFESFYYARPGSVVFHVFFLWWTWLVSYAHYKVWGEYQTASGAKQKQYQYFFVAFTLAFGTGSLDYLPMFGIDVYPYGNFGIILYPIIMTYAIVKYGTMDIQIALERSLAHLLLLIGSAIPAYAIALIGQRMAFGSINLTYSLVLLVLVLLLVLTALHMKSAVQATVARTLFKPRYEMYDVLTNFANAIIGTLDLHAVTDGIVSMLARTLEAKTVSLYLLNGQKVSYVCVSSYGSLQDVGESIKANAPLPLQLVKTKRALLRHDVDATHSSSLAPALLRALDEIHADICLPIISKGRLLGFCSVGERPRKYSDEDVDFLETLSHKQFATAIHYGMLNEELKHAHRAMERTQRLRSLDIMAAGFAHEIRNPLTSIKTFLQLVPDHRGDTEFIQGFSQIACDDVLRIERLIKEILDYARVQNPQFKEEDVNDIVSHCVCFLEIRANQKGIAIRTDLGTDLPRVMLDRQQIKQVVLNLCLNGIDAMVGKNGVLNVTTRQICGPEIKSIQVEVTDTGCGIGPNDLEHIFDPFFTTKHESDEREGTGLGLTISNQIVQDHHGSIRVASVLGKGTAFLIQLPIMQPSSASQNPPLQSVGDPSLSSDYS